MFVWYWPKQGYMSGMEFYLARYPMTNTGEYETPSDSCFMIPPAIGVWE